MGKDTTSKTEKEVWLEEALFGGGHYKTTISDGKDKEEGRGLTAEESQKNAKDKWDKKH